MPTTKAEFQEIAPKLIDDEFADFRRPLVIVTDGFYDPGTETFEAGSTATYQAIRQRLAYQEYQRQDIQVTDFAVVYTRTAAAPSVGQTVTYDGVQCNVIDVMQDAADAAIKLILRAL